MFDILAIPATCDQPLAAVLKKELKDIPDYEALCNELNKLVEEKGKNRFYVIRTGTPFTSTSSSARIRM